MNFFNSRSSTATPSASLIRFYESYGGDHRGRKLEDILQWGVRELESSHDYIQTLFPLPEPSGVQWSVPVIDHEVFNAFRGRTELRQKLRESLRRMLWFYGFELKKDDSGVKVVKGANYEKNSKNWDSRFDHNHLRITRIIRCLRVLGLEEEALAFYKALEENTTQASDRSREFWRRAAERDLNLKPDLETDDEEDNSIGLKFLREFEVQRKKDAKEKEAATVAAAEEEVEAGIKVENAGAGSDGGKASIATDSGDGEATAKEDMADK